MGKWLFTSIGILLCCIGAFVAISGSGLGTSAANDQDIHQEVQATDQTTGGLRDEGTISRIETSKALSAVRANDAFAQAIGAEDSSGLDSALEDAAGPGRDPSLQVENAAPYYVEGERKGVGLVLTLPGPISTDGPWVGFDSEHLLSSTGLDDDQIEQLRSGGLDHDQVDHMILSSGKSMDADAYRSKAYTSQWDSVESIEVWVDDDSGELFFMRPYVAPPLPPQMQGEG